MSKTIRSLFILASLACLPLLAAEKVKVDKLAVKTLPAQVYGQLQKGKDLSLIWKSPDFKPAQTCKIGEIVWKAPQRIGEVIPYLKAQLPEAQAKVGYYTLDLTVTDAKPSRSTFWGGSFHGFCVVEGAVKDPSGKVVAAFVTKEKTEWAGMEDTMKPGLDRMIGGIQSELFK